jgi:hypothetical protein
VNGPRPVQPSRLPNQEYLLGWAHCFMFYTGCLLLIAFLVWRHS